MEDTGSKGGRTRRTAAKAPAASRATAAKPAATPKATVAKKPVVTQKAATKPVVPAPAGSTVPNRAELVRMAAYFRAERRGFAPGYEVEDWLAAEAEVAVKLGSAPRKTPARKPAKG